VLVLVVMYLCSRLLLLLLLLNVIISLLLSYYYGIIIHRCVAVVHWASFCVQFQFFIELCRIRKCFTQKGGVFVLEEYGKRFIAFVTYFCYTCVVVPVFSCHFV